MSKENKTSDKQQNGNDFIANVSKPFIYGVDYIDGQSRRVFAVFKNGQLHWHTTKA